jgi:hypothetical protein
MKNNMGLKGATDALHFAKSMTCNKGSMIKPIKKYETGGMTGDPGDPTEKRKCGKGGCGGKIKSFFTNLFSGNNKSTGGKKNKPSSKLHRIR